VLPFLAVGTADAILDREAAAAESAQPERRRDSPA
jgi:hypothetical protein